MISHLSMGVSDMARGVEFYDAALGALGYARVWTNEAAAGYGPPGGNDKLALFLRPDAGPQAGFHLAFKAQDRAAVARFHQAATQAGGACDGPPGLRPHYGAHYYAAFVIDPDGHRLEAVCQEKP